MRAGAALLVAALLALVSAAFCAPLQGDCALLELLPTDLTGLSFIGADGQAHFQGAFYVDFEKENQHNITFDVKFNSTFRFYVAPHEIDIDLWLYPLDSRLPVTHSSLDVAGAPEVLFGHLAPGGYRLTLYFFGDPNELSDCPAVITEFEVLPNTVLNARVQSFQCPPQAAFPVIDFAPLADGHFNYSTLWLPSSEAANFNAQTHATTFHRDVAWITSYNFTVPRLHGRALLWQFDASLGYQFLTGGSLGLLLVATNASSAPNPRCYLENEGCWLGSNLRMNENVISALLLPGDYQLWLFDQIGEKDPAIALACTPFSLSIEATPTDQEEDFVNCRAARIPHSLNGPDGIDAQGYYTFSNDVLVDFNGSAGPMATLQVARPSLLRVEVFAGGRFDVDVMLYNETSRMRVAGSNRFQQDIDAVVYPLEVGTPYTLRFPFSYHYTAFCETHSLEIAVAPTPSFDFCDGLLPSEPDLSALDAALASNTRLKRVDYGPFYFDYQRNYTSRVIYAHRFNVTVPTNVKFLASYNFLLGGLDLALVRNRTVVRLGEQRGNLGLLQSELPRGEYELQISTSPVSTGSISSNLNGLFPPCLRYELGVAATPAAEAAEDLCWHELQLPADLRALPYLGSSPYVHLDGGYLIPSLTGALYVDDNVTIAVDQPSLFHLYTPARSDLDIRLALYDERGTRVAFSNNQYDEEELAALLVPGTVYTLNAHFVRPRQPLPLCATWLLELLIEPTPTPVPAASCEVSPLPADLLFNTGIVGWHVVRDATYALNNTRRLVIDLPFTIAALSYLRALLAFPFALTQLSLYVHAGANGTSRAPIASSSPASGNQAHIDVLLPPGSYVLRVANPSLWPAGVLPSRCVNLTLVVATASTASESAGMRPPCDAAPLPATFNAAPFLSPLGGYAMHFTRLVPENPFTIDVVATMELPAESLLRVGAVTFNAVLRSERLTLYNLNNTGLSYRASAFSPLVARLPAGTYQLRHQTYSVSALDPDECNTALLEMAVAPMSDLLDNLDITQPCETHSPEVTELQPNVAYTGLKWLYPLPTNATRLFTTVWELQDVGYLAADLRYDFLVGLVMMTLIRGNSTVYAAELSMNHAFIRTALTPGRYNLTVSLPYAREGESFYGNVSFIRCGQFELDFLLNTTADPAFCDEIDALPSDLYTREGGSAAYGGPQDLLDGSVEVYGDRFLVHQGETEADVAFIAPRAIYARFFATAGADSDVDFVLYDNVNKTRILAYSISFDLFESSLFLLPAQNDSYLLSLKFWQLPPLLCPYYRFEAVIRDNATVANALRCPAALPPFDAQVPSATVALAEGASYALSSADYVLTRQRLQAEARYERWERAMALTVPGNTLLYASVLFDFLTADFRLQVSGGDVGADGTPDYANDRGSRFDFENRLVAYLQQPGTYALTLRFHLASSATQLADHCFPFAFSLSLISNVSGHPSVLAVEPPAGDNLQAASGLGVRVVFSEPFVNAAPATNFAKLAALRSIGSGALLSPALALPVGNRTGLRFQWQPSQLQDGAAYDLLLYPALLTASRTGVPYANYTGGHRYAFEGCYCSGHGNCSRAPGGELLCVCTFPYAGYACEACADGYHGVEGRCEADARCAADSCGCVPGTSPCQPLGRCDDSSDAIVCTCYSNRAGDRCEVCATGYGPWPECPAIPPGTDGASFVTTSATVTTLSSTVSTSSSSTTTPAPPSGGWSVTAMVVGGAVVLLILIGVVTAFIWALRSRGSAERERGAALMLGDQDEDENGDLPAPPPAKAAAKASDDEFNPRAKGQEKLFEL